MVWSEDVLTAGGALVMFEVTVAAALGVLHHADHGTLLLTLAHAHPALAQHHRHLPLAGGDGHTGLVTVTTALTSET